MCRSMVDIQSAAAEIRRGIKKDRKKSQGKNIMSASATQGGHKQLLCIAISQLSGVGLSKTSSNRLPSHILYALSDTYDKGVTISKFNASNALTQVFIIKLPFAIIFYAFYLEN